jgi:hypothetical protein
MAKLVLLVDSFQISSFNDGESGYIAAMAAPHNAKIQQAAKIAQASADQESAQAQQESERKQSEYARDTAVLQAKYKADQDQAAAIANQAGPLAQADAEQSVTDKQTELAKRRADLRQQELVAEVVRPAEANAEQMRVSAVAEAAAMETKARAAASNDRVALDRILIEQLPTIVEKAALGLSRANVNILEGADGMAQLAAGLVAQSTTVLEAARHMSNNGNGKGPLVREAQE